MSTAATEKFDVNSVRACLSYPENQRYTHSEIKEVLCQAADNEMLSADFHTVGSTSKTAKLISDEQVSALVDIGFGVEFLDRRSDRVRIYWGLDKALQYPGRIIDASHASQPTSFDE